MTKSVSPPDAPIGVAGGAIRRPRRVPKGFFVALQEAGVALSRFGSSTSLDGPPVVIEAEALDALVDAVLIGGPPELGLRIGEHIRPELFDVVGLALLSAETYGRGVSRCARYKRLLMGVRVDIEVDGRYALVRVDVDAPDSPAAIGRIDAELAFIARFGRTMTVKPVIPLELRLRPSSSSYAAQYARVFGCRTQFGSKHDELVLPASSLDVPLLGASETAHTMLVAEAERRLQGLEELVSQRVRAIVEGLLPDGTPQLREVARHLGMSSRSLQRRLLDERTSFGAVVDEARRMLACRYLERPELEALEVSFLVGFAQPNSFYRAFRRWTGTTPEEFRRRATAPRR